MIRTGDHERLTLGWVCGLIFVDRCLDVAEGGRRRTLLQDADGVTKLICKLDTQNNTTRFEQEATTACVYTSSGGRCQSAPRNLTNSKCFRLSGT